MKLTATLLLLLFASVAAYSQGITLLYKGGGSGGWNDASNWIQINTPVGQTPVQRIPTEYDHVIFSKSMSGLSSAGIVVEQLSDSITVGINRTSGIRCRSMRISNMGFGVFAKDFNQYYPQVLVSTANGGFVLIDSNSTIGAGEFQLLGGNPNIYDLEIVNSSYGAIKTHNWDLGSIHIGKNSRAKMVNTVYGSFSFQADSTSELYAENCSFNINRFKIGFGSKATMLDCTFTDYGASSGSLSFGIDPNVEFRSDAVKIEPFFFGDIYTSGSVLKADINVIREGYLHFSQANPEKPLPNIIDGNVSFETGQMKVKGDLKLSGDLNNRAINLLMNFDTSHVYINGQHIFKTAGISSYGNTTDQACIGDHCRFKLELFGNTDTEVVWPVGFPVDTLIINKTNCAKVTFQNSLYVAGETRILGGQLRLDPNPGIPYKFVCPGDITIAKGGGIFLRRNSDGVVANMAVSGSIRDQNTAKDSVCAGLSNPYSGTIFNEDFTGITLLYKSNNSGGWNNPSNWIQINSPAGKTPIQRVPTELDDVVFSRSMSGLNSVGFAYEDSVVIGGNKTTGNRCRSMRISGMSMGFGSYVDYAAPIHVYTTNGGQLRIDSSSYLSEGNLILHGGNKNIYDLEIIDSKYGRLFSHAVWSSVSLKETARARFINSSIEGWHISSYPSGGEVYAENCTFMTPSFILGESSKASIIDCSIANGNNFITLNFGIGPDSEFISRNVEIKSFHLAEIYTSGSVLKANITCQYYGDIQFSQYDTTKPLPNIIDGNVIFHTGPMRVKGDLKISGNLINQASDILMYPDTSRVLINGQHIFTTAGISLYRDNNGNSCTGDHCRFNLELFGGTDTKVIWSAGFPVDTLIINKTNCAKVTFQNSLYVAGETRIRSGQLALDPNDTIPYKMVSAGDINISPGGSLFLRRNSEGVAANIAVGGAINDANTAVDTTCAGFANPYDGTVGFYSGIQNVVLKPLAIQSNTTISNLVLHGDPGTNFFLEKDITVKQLRFAGQASLLLGNHSLTVTDSLLNFGPSSFIVTNGTGTLRRNNIGSKETVFPVGTSISSYNPLTLTNAGAADNFRVRVQPAVYTAGTNGTTVTEKAVNRTWLVEEETPGGSNATLKLQWNATDELPGFSRTAAYLSHFTSSKWNESTPLAATGSNPYSVTRSSLSSFSPFAVFSTIASSVSVPSEQAIQVYPNPVKDRLYVQMPGRLVTTTLQVQNSQGVILKNLQVRAGATLTPVTIADLPAGIYSITLSAGTWRETRRFIKQ